MTDAERQQIIDAIVADLRTGPNGNRVLPVGERPPFDWGAVWKEVGPYILRIVTIILAAAATYFGIQADHKAGEASNQSKENATAIKATHVEVGKMRMVYGKAPE